MLNNLLKKKNFLFFRLTFLTLTISIFLKIFNFDTYFLEISKPLKNKKLIDLLKKFHIFWVYNKHIDIKSFRKIHRIKSYLTDKIANNFTNLIWNENLKKEFNDKKYFKLMIIDKLKPDVEKLTMLIVGKKKISLKKEKEFFLSSNMFGYLMKHMKKEIVFINSFSFLVFCLFLIKKLFYIIYNKLLKFLFFFISSQKKTLYKKKSFNQKVIYFPHKGLIHGKGLTKNFIYSNSIEELKKENIIHVELHGTNYNNTYEELGIEPIHWNQISYQFKFEHLKSILKIIKYKNICNFDKLVIASVFVHFEIIKSKLSNYKDIKFAFFGYDLLTSYSIIAVCNYLKIKTISYQTRSTAAFFYKRNLYFDYFFCFGEKMKKIYEKNQYIKKIYLIGNYFSNQTSKFNHVENEIREKKQNFKKVCLVFDHHTTQDYFINKLDPIVNLKNNLNFYNDLYEVASKFKDVLFILKSKNLNWMSHTSLNSIVKKFNSLDNLKISKNTVLPDLYRFSDFAYGVISSGLDDMLALNKPIIIKDILGHPSYKGDYGILIAKSKKELMNKLSLIINDNKEFNEQILNVKRQMFINYNNYEKEKIFKKIILKNE